MKKSFYLLLLLMVSIGYSQNSDKELELKETIGVFFEGLHNGDTITLKKAIHDQIKLQTTFVNKEGKSVLRTDAKESLLKSIASKKKEDVWFEKILSYDIKIDGNLASVWTPYEFYRNGEFSHCGVNSFQLFNNNGAWQIVYLVDTRRRQGCEISK